MPTDEAFAPTTFTVVISEVDDDYTVELKLITGGPLERAVDIFIAAATEPDEATLTLGNGMTVRSVPATKENQ